MKNSFFLALFFTLNLAILGVIAELNDVGQEGNKETEIILDENPFMLWSPKTNKVLKPLCTDDIKSPLHVIGDPSQFSADQVWIYNKKSKRIYNAAVHGGFIDCKYTTLRLKREPLLFKPMKREPTEKWTFTNGKLLSFDKKKKINVHVDSIDSFDRSNGISISGLISFADNEIDESHSLYRLDFDRYRFGIFLYNPISGLVVTSSETEQGKSRKFIGKGLQKKSPEAQTFFFDRSTGQVFQFLSGKKIKVLSVQGAYFFGIKPYVLSKIPELQKMKEELQTLIGDNLSHSNKERIREIVTHLKLLVPSRNNLTSLLFDNSTNPTFSPREVEKLIDLLPTGLLDDNSYIDQVAKPVVKRLKYAVKATCTIGKSLYNRLELPIVPQKPKNSFSQKFTYENGTFMMINRSLTLTGEGSDVIMSFFEGKENQKIELISLPLKKLLVIDMKSRDKNIIININDRAKVVHETLPETYNASWYEAHSPDSSTVKQIRSLNGGAYLINNGTGGQGCSFSLSHEDTVGWTMKDDTITMKQGSCEIRAMTKKEFENQPPQNKNWTNALKNFFSRF